jgi:sugar phosphate isomerase/epimerase
MINRRDFFRFSLAGLGALSATKLFGVVQARPLGVQLYTVRDQAERDLAGVLAAIREIGYQEVELYWNVYNLPAAELRKMLDDHGLRAPSGHVNYEGLDSKLDYAQTLGFEYVVCPMLPEKMRGKLDGFKEAADQFNIWGEKVRQRGMRFGFHNHNYEFRLIDGKTGFETLMERTDPKLVSIEMDCYWIVQAGQDPVEMFKRYGSRIRMLHLKDRKPGFPTSQELNVAAEHFTEVGAGTLDWKAILSAAKQNGVEHLFVERDSGDLPALESLRISFKNLQALL